MPQSMWPPAKKGACSYSSLPLLLTNRPNGLLHDLSFAAHADALGTNAVKYLLPNTYLAVLEGNPFLENALGAASSAKRTKSSCVVFGLLDEQMIDAK